MSVRIAELKGALPVSWKYRIEICPPDCGGPDFDEIEYQAECPKCSRELDNATNYCPNCGQKLWWHVTEPEILE